MLMDHLTETDDDLERSLESGFIIMQVNHHCRRRWKGLARPISLSCSPTIFIRSSTSAVLISARFKCKRNVVVDWVVRYHLRHSPHPCWSCGGRPPCPPCVASSSFPSPSIGSTSRREDEWQIWWDKTRFTEFANTAIRRGSGGWLMKAPPTWHWTGPTDHFDMLILCGQETLLGPIKYPIVKGNRR